MSRGSIVLYNYEGLWVRAKIMYCSAKRARVKWQDKAGQHIVECGFRKLVAL